MGNSDKLWTAEFIGMSLSCFFIYITQYALLAALPLIIMTDFGGGELETGLAMTFFQLGTIVARPTAGILIDSLNKRRLLFIVTTIFFIVMAAFSIVSDLEQIYGLRLIHGSIFAISTTVIASIVAMILPPSRKGEGIGYFALSTSVAMVLGPLIGLLFISHGSSRMLYFSLAVISLLAIYSSGRKKLPDEIVLPATNNRPQFKLSAFIERTALMPALIAGIVFLPYGSILTFIPLYAQNLGMQDETSLFYAVYAISIIVTRPFVGRIFDCRGASFIIYPSLLLFGTGMYLLGNIATVYDLAVCAGIMGVGFGAISPALQTLAVKNAPAERTGVANATYFWSLDISVGLAALVLGYATTHYGYSFVYGVLDVGIIALAALTYYLWRYTKK